MSMNLDQYPMGTFSGDSFGKIRMPKRVKRMARVATLPGITTYTKPLPKFKQNKKSNVKLKWKGRLSGLGYYGDNPSDVAPAEPGIFDKLTMFVEKAKPTVTSGRKLVQAIRGPKDAIGPAAATVEAPRQQETPWLIYGIGALAIAGGAYFLLKR